MADLSSILPIRTRLRSRRPFGALLRPKCRLPFTGPAPCAKKSHKDRRHIAPEQLDRLDYLIAQLKKHGIHANINLHVGRKLGEADGGIPFAGRFRGRSWRL